MLHFRANHFAARHFAALHLRGPAASGGDTHDGGGWIPEHLYKWWKKQHEKKKPTIEEVIEAVQENPVEALKAVPQAKKQFQGIDYSKVKQNAEMALFIAQELMIVLEMRRISDEDEETAIEMLLLM
jgi:Txe/YoeB family toxin of Txe-Axe toxin-antitoxin module